MRDFHIPSPEIEAVAKLIDPDAWFSSDTEAGAFELRYRRYRAREQAGWPYSRATASPTPDTDAAKVAPVIEGEGSREAFQTLHPTQPKER